LNPGFVFHGALLWVECRESQARQPIAVRKMGTFLIFL